MGHFAKVVDGKVTQVIVAEPDFFDTFVDSSPGAWIQTSYNTHGGQHTNGGTALRGNYAGIGYTYDQANDVFMLLSLMQAGLFQHQHGLGKLQQLIHLKVALINGKKLLHLGLK